MNLLRENLVQEFYTISKIWLKVNEPVHASQWTIFQWRVPINRSIKNDLVNEYVELHMCMYTKSLDVVKVHELKSKLVNFGNI